MQNSSRAFELHGLHKLIHKRLVGLPLQPPLAEPGIEGVVQQAGAVGAHIERHRQGPGGVETGAEAVDGQLPLADVDPADPLIADPQDPFRIRHQHQLHRAGQGIAKHLAQAPLLVGTEEHSTAGRAVAPAEPLDHGPHGGGVHDRQHRLHVLGQEAVKQHQVAAPQAIHKRKALEVAPQRAERLPAALHLEVQRLDLGREQALQPQGLTLRQGEGRALVVGGVPEEISPPLAGQLVHGMAAPGRGAH